MTATSFWVVLAALTVLALLLRGAITALFAGIVLLFQFLSGWLLAAGCFWLGSYCLSGNTAMPITRVVGVGAVLLGLAFLGSAVGLFHSATPKIVDTTIGNHFNTRRELRRAGLLRKNIDA
jgi:ABC-type transport system involved in multi-copper enzyme maturation permease subunit